MAHGEQVLTGDSFFHLSAFGAALPGLNLCGAGRVVCLIDPVGDVYACPFAIHEASWRVTSADPGGFDSVWKTSELFADLRKPQTGGACKSCGVLRPCRGGCMAAKFFTGLPLDGPDPECVQGYGEPALASGASLGRFRCRGRRSTTRTAPPRAAAGAPVPVSIARRRPPATTATRARSLASRRRRRVRPPAVASLWPSFQE